MEEKIVTFIVKSSFELSEETINKELLNAEVKLNSNSKLRFHLDKVEEKEEEIVKIIEAIRESFGASVTMYRFGNCYQFYEILKTIFPKAEAFYDGNHVWTKIDGEFYDIMGETNIGSVELTPVIDEDTIASLSTNKWTDKRRKDLKE